MISLIHAVPLLACAIAWSAPVGARDSLDEADLALAYGDKDTVSIATGSAQPLRRAPSVATVITAEEIRAMGARDLDEVMEAVPGVHVSYNNRYFSTYQIRGIAGNQTNPQVLVLQNGIPMNTLYRGDKGQGWSGMPLTNVARVEIIRGPGSALYGADAYAGVINIVTKTAADTPGTEVGVGGGSFATWDTWVQHGGQWGAADVAAYLRLGGSDGQRGIVAADAQSARDALAGTHASLAPGPVSLGYDAIDASLDLGLGLWRVRAGYKLRDDLGLGTGITSALDPVGDERSERASADVSWLAPQFRPDWGLGGSASFLYYSEIGRYQLSPPGTSFDGKNLNADGSITDPALCVQGLNNCFPDGMLGQPERFERQLRLSGFATYTGFADHNLRFGLGHDDLDMYKIGTHKNYLLSAAGAPIPTGPMIDYQTIQPHQLPSRRRVDYLYAQDEWSFARDWTLTAGLRHDRYSDFGGTTNPRLALVWDARNDLTAKLLYGQAFRAPSATEQYGINPVANGNPDLRPETIGTLEAALAWQASRNIQVNLSIYRYQMDDVIRAVANTTPPGATFQNTGGQHGSGLELEATWDVEPNLRLTGNYAWQRSIDEATDRDAGYAPHHRLYARADWSVAGPWHLSAQVDWVADRRRAAGDTRPGIDDYATVDLTLRNAKPKRDWNIAVMARNLFDADAREPSLAPSLIPNDLPLPGRNLYLELRYQWPR